MALKQDSNKHQSPFWSTLPGIITALATLITSLGGLYVLLKNDTIKPLNSLHKLDTIIKLPNDKKEEIHIATKQKFDTNKADQNTKSNKGQNNQLLRRDHRKYETVKVRQPSRVVRKKQSKGVVRDHRQ